MPTCEPSTDESLLTEARSAVHKASLWAVEDLGLIQGDTEETRQDDLASLANNTKALYIRLNKAYPRHRRGRVRAWCAKNLYDIAREVDDRRGAPTFLPIYRLLYATASRAAHSDPSTVGMIRADDPKILLMGPDPTMTIPAVSAIGQLLLDLDELVNDLFQLGLNERLGKAIDAFKASLS